MSCCCSNPYPIHCGSICDGLTINYIAPAAATYTLIADYLGSTIAIQKAVLLGETLAFDMSNLNAFYRYQFRVMLNGEYLTFIDADGNIYNCFDVHLQPFGATAETVALDLVTP